MMPCPISAAGRTGIQPLKPVRDSHLYAQDSEGHVKTVFKECALQPYLEKMTDTALSVEL
jgi:hypothetical protein